MSAIPGLEAIKRDDVAIASAPMASFHIEIRQNGDAVDSYVIDTAAGTRILNLGELQRELIIAVCNRDVIAEISVIALPGPTVK